MTPTTTRRRSSRRPRKSLGQHFLRDRRIIRQIINALDIQPGETIIEIGPGRGALTKLLAEEDIRLILVEIDDDLAADLTEKYADVEHVRVAHADARTLSADDVPEMAQGPFKVVGNLPYYAASPIIRNLLESPTQPTEMVVMVQREVGLEMTAKPGKMSLLSVATLLYAACQRVCYAPPQAFAPPPKVRSAVLKLQIRDKPLVDFDSPETFFKLAKAGFAAPRKTLANSLAVGFDSKGSAFTEIIETAGLDPVQRPATLSMHDWDALFQAWVAARPEQRRRAGQPS